MYKILPGSSGRANIGKASSKRNFISQSMGGIAFLGAAGAIELKESPDKSDRSAVRKLKVIVSGGHTGDPEYGCRGTIAKYTDLGHEVVLLYLNRGEGGIEGKSAGQAQALIIRVWSGPVLI